MNQAITTTAEMARATVFLSAIVGFPVLLHSAGNFQYHDEEEIIIVRMCVCVSE